MTTTIVRGNSPAGIEVLVLGAHIFSSPSATPSPDATPTIAPTMRANRHGMSPCRSRWTKSMIARAASPLDSSTAIPMCGIRIAIIPSARRSRTPRGS
jgi:hypothetical protein